MFRSSDKKKVYKSDRISTTAVDGVDLKIERGDFLSIVGASGSGKSSLMYLLAGMMKPGQRQDFSGKPKHLGYDEESEGKILGM